MYTEFLKELAELSEICNTLASRETTAQSGMPLPYVSGDIPVFLDGDRIGHFRIEDDYALYEEEVRPNEAQGETAHQ